MEEEKKVETELVDEGGNHRGEEDHRAASYELRHRGSHHPILDGKGSPRNISFDKLGILSQPA